MTYTPTAAMKQFAADLEKTAQMQRRYSPAVMALSKVLAEHFVAPLRVEERRLVAV